VIGKQFGHSDANSRALTCFDEGLQQGLANFLTDFSNCLDRGDAHIIVVILQ